MLTVTERALLVPLIDNPAYVDLRVHENGFIQVDLGETHRLHVWSPLIPRQKVSTQIHDHRFDFESKCLVGLIFHHEYGVAFRENGPLQTYIWESPEGLVPTENGRCFADELRVIPVNEGETYQFDAKEFHETTYNKLSVTLMRKIRTWPAHSPRVLCQVGLTPDNSFNRYDYGHHLATRKVFRQAIQELRSRL